MYKKMTLILLVVLTTAVAYSSDHLDLWHRGRQIARDNWNWVAGKTIQTSTTLQEKDKEALDVNEVWLAKKLFEGNLLQVEIIKATSDGEELSRKDALNRWEMLLTKDYTPQKKGVFFASDDELTISYLGEEERVGEYLCAVFQYDYTPSDKEEGGQSGKIWLDKETGAPIKKVGELHKKPRFVTDIEIEELFHFDQVNNHWYIEQVTSLVNVSALGKKMENLTVIDYQEHWLFPN